MRNQHHHGRVSGVMSLVVKVGLRPHTLPCDVSSSSVCSSLSEHLRRVETCPGGLPDMWSELASELRDVTLINR